MGFFINGKAVDSVDSNWSGTLKDIKTLTSDDDIDQIKEQGIFKISYEDDKNKPANNVDNSIVRNPKYWTLIVIKHDYAQIQQFAISESTIAWRWLNDKEPRSIWRKVAFDDDLQKMNDRIKVLENKIGGYLKSFISSFLATFSIRKGWRFDELLYRWS